MTLAADPVASSGRLSSRKRGVGIRAQGLIRKFADRTVLEGLDLSVDAGAFVAVVGRSGCGKSTLLRLAAGLDAPDGGRLAFGGGETPGDVARVMFQEPRLLPWASVIANVELGLGASHSSLASKALALSALDAVGLSERANDWPSILSGGQRQRVALARALVSRPRFLALDEPLGALDALTRIEMQRLIEAIWLRERFTAVLVTHDVAEAIALADRIVLLEQGRIARDIAVDLPRPRQRGSDAFGALEENILRRLIGEIGGASTEGMGA